MSQAQRRSTTKAKPARRFSIDAPGLGMLVVGMVVGAVATALWYGINSTQPATFGGGLRALIEASKSRSTDAETESSTAVQTEVAAPSTKLEFYKVLPDTKIEYLPPPDEASISESEPIDTGETEQGVFYFLQVGSYGNFKDADRLKAKLALSGLEAHIQPVSIEGEGVYHRVRLGPFINFGKLAKTHRRLSEQGINAIRLRISGAKSG